MGGPAYLSEFYYRYAEEASNDKQFRCDHAAFVKGFRVRDSLYNLMFYPIFLFRRTCYAAVLVFLADFPRLQLALVIISSLVVRKNIIAL